jgi:glycosyltransferase involved in cell wall biosynthesis
LTVTAAEADHPAVTRAMEAAALVIVGDEGLLTHVASAGASDRARLVSVGLDLTRHPWQPIHPEARVVLAPVGDELARAAAEQLGRRHPELDVRLLDQPEDGGGDRAFDGVRLLVAARHGRGQRDLEANIRLVLAAQARGIPVVLPYEGDPPPLLAPKAGRTVRAHPDAVDGAAEDLLQQPDESGSGAGRRQVALRFELGARAADLEDLYAAVVADGAPNAVRSPRGEWPHVSVVVPTHNRLPLLRRTLDALAQQTYPSSHLEVVVVDDGSDDGTAAELRDRRLPCPFRVLRHERRSSAADARNTGVAASTGEVIAFTDSDCRPATTWVEALVAGLVDGIGLVQGRVGPDPDQPLEPLSRTLWVPYEYGLYETSNVAYTRDALDTAGRPPFRSDLTTDLVRHLGSDVGRQAFGEDTELGWRAKRSGIRSRFATRAVVHHHVFPPDRRYLFRRSALTGGFPLLARRVPELRTAYFHHRVFLGPHRPLFYAAALGAVIAHRRALALVLAMPYLWHRVQPGRPGRAARVAAAPTLAACDVVETAALIYGSALSRRLVL